MRCWQMLVAWRRLLLHYCNTKIVKLFLFLIFSLTPAAVMGISQPINIQVEGLEIRQIIKSIEQQSDYRFFYTDGLADLNRKVSMHYASESIDSVLSMLLGNTQLGYRISNDNRVILAPKETIPQEIVITGTVTDKDGPMPGVNIIVKGTSQGTVTDVNGTYSIAVPGKDSRLLFSFLGYVAQEVVVGDRTVLDITLSENLNELQEVVVVGYGTVNKVTLTGAVSSVNTNDLLRNPVPNVGNMLVGQVSGLSAIQTTGKPGGDNPELFVRGIGTLNAANSRPLMLIDGVERDFFQLDPNEIESISVLKDASATAVFGVQGANGVIIVTTRRGTEGAPKISVSLSAGMQMPLRVLKFANSYEYGVAYNEVKGYDYFSDEVLEKYKTGSDPLLYPSYDWTEELIRKAAFQTQNNINITGGTKFVKYFVSLGYLSQDGIFKKLTDEFHDNFTYNRYNYRANFDIDATKTTTLKISLGGVAGIRQEPRCTDGQNNIMRNIYWGLPFSTPGIIDGKLVQSNPRYNPNIGGLRPAFAAWYGQGTSYFSTNDLNMDLSANQDLKFILQGLSANVKYSYSSSYGHQKDRTYNIPTYTPWRIGDTNDWQNVDPTADPNEVVFIKSGEETQWGYSESFYDRSRRYYAEGSLSYARTFGPHQVSLLTLGNLKKTYYLNPNRYNYTEIPLGSLGLVGRATYNYAQRYLLDFNVGYNGSENFAEGKRFGLFPAVSLGWVVSEEKFMKNAPFISFLKLRVSEGKVGSDYVGQNRFLYLPDTWNPNASAALNSYLFGTGNTIISNPGAIENSLGNPEVTWETAVKQNYGIDINFFNNRLALNADAFFEKRTGILAQRNTVPAYVAAVLPRANIGKVDNHGYELLLKWKDNIANKNGTYWTTASVSFNRNKIVYMDEVHYDYSWQQRTGHPVETNFGYMYERLYKSSDFPEAQKYGSFLAPGDMKFTDKNNDGVIDGNDECPIGYSRYPEYTFSLNLGCSYKNFDFSMLWQGVTNVSKAYYELYRQPFTAGIDRALMYYVYKERFVSEELTPNATYPRLTEGARAWNFSQGQLNSYWVKDATYVRLKNIEVGYSVKAALLKKAGISRMRIYLNGTNLFTFDKMRFLDPEDEAGRGASRGEYPIVAITNMGVNFNF